MGGIISALQSLWGIKSEVKVLMLGLDGSGKTTTLHRFQCGEVVSTVPTVGFNMESVAFNNILFQVWDLGGQTSIRGYWRYYFGNTQAIIFVIDSTDANRLETAKAELSKLLVEEELANSSVVVFSNKSDLQNSLPPSKISEALALSKIKNRPWAIFKTSALTGEGLKEGLEWLAQSITQK
uniref:Uncharacterized protein n=1 Tax=Arcella intermedia TaxID=1963864 RepID=A0A6B2LLA0_9EUKA